MSISAVRAWRDSLLAAVLALSAMAVLAAASYTPEERKFVDKLPQMFQSTCEQGVAKAQLEESAQTRAATSEWMKAISGPKGVCACVTQQVMTHVTPDLLHRRDVGQVMNGYVADAGATCMAQVMQTTFPAICPGMMARTLVSKGQADAASYAPSLCQCLQTRINALSPAELRPYMQQLMAQDSTTGSARDVPLPAGFQRDVRECGYATANRIIDDRTAAAKAATEADTAAVKAAAAADAASVPEQSGQ